MSWFDNDPKATLEQKVAKAADYYSKKYKKTPNLVFVHPTMLPLPESPDKTTDTQKIQFSGVEIRPDRSILPNHLWMGVNG